MNLGKVNFKQKKIDAKLMTAEGRACKKKRREKPVLLRSFI